jgi:hypothetical protein
MVEILSTKLFVLLETTHSAGVIVQMAHLEIGSEPSTHCRGWDLEFVAKLRQRVIS